MLLSAESPNALLVDEDDEEWAEEAAGALNRVWQSSAWQTSTALSGCQSLLGRAVPLACTPSVPTIGDDGAVSALVGEEPNPPVGMEMDGWLAMRCCLRDCEEDRVTSSGEELRLPEEPKRATDGGRSWL